ncbi:uncharacterized protein LOC142563933 [Dermacentor variabilis]|uniref:uncharacterized protein LOC142563933 n=1 Tax=Dermacentor variabilis TaxID=34621 RepID=UPI003F5BD494
MAESTGSNFMMVGISGGKRIPCEIFQKDKRNLPLCENCGFYTQTRATLICKHKLCEECFNSSIDYICKQDHWRTTKDQARRGSSTSEIQDVRLYCPRCPNPMPFNYMVEHIRSEHPELFENADEPLKRYQREVNDTGNDSFKDDGKARQRGVEDMQNMVPSPRHACIDAQCDTEMMTDDDSSDSLPGAPDKEKLDHEIGTCKHCNTPLEKKAIEEHEATCLYRNMTCPNCKEKMAAKDLDVHTKTLCPAKEKKTTDKLRIQRKSDDSNERKELMADVQELKERIHALEETMNRIQPPLLKIIERLS